MIQEVKKKMKLEVRSNTRPFKLRGYIEVPHEAIRYDYLKYSVPDSSAYYGGRKRMREVRLVAMTFFPSEGAPYRCLSVHKINKATLKKVPGFKELENE